ncbi:MAG: hypothetical protein MUC98_08860, partial [Desulfobacterota bacterium]|nr:hypothetical protein [Thermodesulfobacteriota bacterium]
MSTYLYRLEFTGPIHFGQTGIGLEEASERLPSDSLASALINAAAVAGKLESFLSMFQGRDPALRLSSLFPFGPDPAQNGRSGYLVPRPLMMPPLADSSILGSMGKDLKRLKYLKAQDAWHWLAGPPLKPGELELFLKRNQTLGGRWDPEKQTGWWAEELRPRVAL